MRQKFALAVVLVSTLGWVCSSSVGFVSVIGAQDAAKKGTTTKTESAKAGADTSEKSGQSSTKTTDAKATDAKATAGAEPAAGAPATGGTKASEATDKASAEASTNKTQAADKASADKTGDKADKSGDVKPATAAEEDAAGQSQDRTAANPEETMSASTYTVKLRDLEQRINQLKDRVFKSKARLSLLAETVLSGVVGGSQAIISHTNNMSGSYRLIRMVYALDGAPIFTRADDEGILIEAKEMDIYHGSIVPGEHTLTVNLEYRGHGYGVFSYLKGYRFKVRTSHTFTAHEGKTLHLRVTGFERGGPTEAYEERPSIRVLEDAVETSRGKEEPQSKGGK